MVVKEHTSKKFKHLACERGQSLLEFLILLPIFIGIFVLMLKVNAATQISIVNQKYTRSTLLFMTFNHPWLVKRSIPVVGGGTSFGTENAVSAQGYNRLTMGLSEEVNTGGNYVPSATTLLIARNDKVIKGKTKDSDEKTEPTDRAYVRIRNTTTICLPLSFSDKKNPVLSSYTAAPNPFRRLEDGDTFAHICNGPKEIEGGS